LDQHSIDVSVLGASLTGLGELLKSANNDLNGQDVNVRVVMHADVEANCVTMDFTVLTSIFEHLRQLFGTAGAIDAKNMLEWLGIISTGGSTVWGLLKWAAARKPGEKITSTVNGDSITINITGSNNSIIVPSAVYKLAADPRIQKGIKDLLSPLKEEGINDATVIHEGKEVVFTKAEAKEVLESNPLDLDLETDPQTVVGHIEIYSPIFTGDAKRWKFKWNGRVEQIDISKSNIAAEILQRGKVVVGDAFKVQMEVIEKKTSSGWKQSFKVMQTLAFIPAPEQDLLPRPINEASGDQ